MTSFNPKEPAVGNNGNPAPPPRCASWSDITFLQWMTLHGAQTFPGSRVCLDGDFAPGGTSTVFSEWAKTRFRHSHIAGRSPSPLRQTLPFYAAIDYHCRPHMRDFLNYIISYGGAVSDKTVSTILPCLGSRHWKYDLRLFGPTWGSHETFECGTW